MQRSNLGTNKILSQYARVLQAAPSSFIGDRVLPRIPVRGLTGKFFSIAGGMGYASPPQGIVRASGADFVRAQISVSQVALYTLAESGIEVAVDDVDQQFGVDEQLDLQKRAARQSWQFGMVERERTRAALLFSATTFSGFTAALSGSSRWDTAGSDPRDQAITASQSIVKATGIGRRMLSLIVGQEVWDQLSKSAALLQYVRASAPGVIDANEAQVASALGIREVIVGGAPANTAKEGQTESSSFIWGKGALFAYLESSPSALECHGIGGNFQHASRPQGEIELYREEPRSEVALASWLEQPVVTTAGAGYYFSTVVN